MTIREVQDDARLGGCRRDRLAMRDDDAIGQLSDGGAFLPMVIGGVGQPQVGQNVLQTPLWTQFVCAVDGIHDDGLLIGGIPTTGRYR